MKTQAQKFEAKLNKQFGANFKSIKLSLIDLHAIEGNPQVAEWGSFGDFEVIKFTDGSTYEITEPNKTKL